ncbi:hypothetical protein ANO11243_010490 [Dothideomycetidae sp. 11243]|nr:hypothetical protein ANO11243_010490 [fungal sp. No.11243]
MHKAYVKLVTTFHYAVYRNLTAATQIGPSSSSRSPVPDNLMASLVRTDKPIMTFRNQVRMDTIGPRPPSAPVAVAGMVDCRPPARIDFDASFRWPENIEERAIERGPARRHEVGNAAGHSMASCSPRAVPGRPYLKPNQGRHAEIAQFAVLPNPRGARYGAPERAAESSSADCSAHRNQGTCEACRHKSVADSIGWRGCRRPSKAKLQKDA